jgi:hypothetical protein
MNHYLRQMVGTCSALGLLCLSSIGVFAQPSRPPQPGKSSPSPSASPSSDPSAPASPSSKPSNPSIGWKNFRFPEGRFTVSFPQEPIKSSEKDSDGDVSYTYKVEREEGFYVISHIDIASLKRLPSSDVRDMLQKMPADLVKAIDGKLVGQKSISLRQKPGQEFEFSMPINGKQTPGKGRIYAVGTRIYTLISVGNSKDASRFISSFNLI